MALLTITSTATSIFLLWLLVTAGLHKLKTDNNFYYEVVMANYGISYQPLARLLPKVIGVFEIAIGIMLVMPFTSKIGAMLACGMFAIYLLTFIAQLSQGKSDIDCGCAGPDGDLKVSIALVWRNLALCLLAFLSYQGAISAQVTSINFWLLTILTAFMLSIIYLCTEQVIGNSQKIQLINQHK